MPIKLVWHPKMHWLLNSPLLLCAIKMLLILALRSTTLLALDAVFQFTFKDRESIINIYLMGQQVVGIQIFLSWPFDFSS